METRIPPVVLVAIAAGAMWLLARWLPMAHFDVPGRLVLSSGLVVVGALVAVSGIAEFRRARTTVDPTHPAGASSLVTTGVYKRTRNPMYLGFALMLVAWSFYLGNFSSMALVSGFVAYMNRFHIIPEERVLEGKFGPAFLNYRARTRRWL